MSRFSISHVQPQASGGPFPTSTSPTSNSSPTLNSSTNHTSPSATTASITSTKTIFDNNYPTASTQTLPVVENGTLEVVVYISSSALQNVSGIISSTVLGFRPTSPYTSPSALTTPPSASFLSSIVSLEPSSTPVSSIAPSIAPPINTSSTPRASQIPSSTPATSKSSSSSSSLSGGAIAGIVVGVIAALLLLIGATFIFRRTRRQKKRKHGDGTTFGLEKPIGNVETSHTTRNIGNHEAWEEDRPAAADDATIKMEIGTLFDQVELHVENFFTPVEVTSRPSKTEIERLDRAHFRSLSNLKTESIFKTENQLAVIKCHLATIAVAALGYSSDPFFSLVPPQFSTFPATISSVADKQQQQSRAIEQSRAQWRVLSTFLRPDLENNDPVYVANRDQKIRSIVKDFDDAFAPWIHNRYSLEEKLQNISGILVKASRLGMFLISQPTPFTFDWTVGPTTGRRSNLIVVTPKVLRGGEGTAWDRTEAHVLIDARSAVF